MKRFVLWGILLTLLLLRVETLQGQNYNMTNGQTITTCSGNFYDSGGPNSAYGPNQHLIETFKTASPNLCLKVTFTKFQLESGQWDYLKIYDGENTSAPLIGTYYSNNSPGVVTSSSGALTFEFYSDNYIQYSGWKAYFSCVECPPPLPPTPSANPCSINGLNPFCTDENPYGITFPSGTSGDASSFLGTSDISCLHSSPNPAWYYMQITNPGNLLIYIQQFNTLGHGTDVDFVCWGPFEADNQSDFVNKFCNGVYSLDDIDSGNHRPNNGIHQNNMGGYPAGNVVDCSWSAASTEWCYIPNAQQGEWYVLLLTNYSGSQGTITFSPVTAYSTSSTNCNLLIPISSNGPFCEGDTLVLTCENPQEGVSYHWSGPEGWSDITTVPNVSIPNVTVDQSGQYNLIITGTNISVDSSHVNIVIRPRPQLTLTAPKDTICDGDMIFLDAVVVNNGSQQINYQWNTGDTIPFILVSDSGLYSVNIENEYGCTADSSMWIALNSPRFTYIDTMVCDSLVWMDSVLTENGEYSFTFTASNGCDSVVTLHLTIAEDPIIDAFMPTYMIAGDTLPVVIGTLVGDNVQYAVPQNTLCHVQTIHLPDGVSCEPYGCSYLDTLNFSGFPDSAVIGSANDIHYVRLNMEHSWVRDLYINLTCPNGQKSVILKKAITTSSSSCLSQIPQSDRGWKNGNNISNQALLGLSYVQYDPQNRCDSSAPKNRPGTGWNYCWSSDTIDNYLYAPGAGSLLYRTVHAHNQTVLGHTYKVIDSSNVANKSNFYHPDESFDSLVGCPINGTWTVEVMDGITAHNGYLFSWEISLADHLAPNHYLPVTQTLCSGPWVTPVTDSTYLITPPDTLAHDTLVPYTFTLIDELGCSYDTTLKIMIYAHRHTDIFDSACISYPWHDSIYYESGIYIFDTTGIFHTDSTVKLHLTIYSPDTIPIYDTAFNSYYWHDSTYYQSGVYFFDTTNIHNCDSTEILHLTIFIRDTVPIFDSACIEYTWHDSTYYESGVYYFDTTNIHNCDSTEVLYLTIFSPDTIPTFDTICSKYTWHDSTYYESGEYHFDTINIHGCDSIVILQLTIFTPDTTIIFDTACERYIWHDSTYYLSGKYHFSTTNIHGCDSTEVLQLTINPIPEIHISGPSIFCADSAILSVDVGNTYLWNTGDTTQQLIVTEPGIYSVTYTDTNGCQAADTHRIVAAYPGPIATATMPELCAGTSDTITVGYQSGASIVLLNPDDITSSELDTVTKVTLVTMSGLWVTEPAINDSTFLLSPPDDLAEDTTVNYVFHLEDSFGCGYDTNFDILFHAHHLRTADTTVCNKFSWNDVIYTASDTIKQPVTNDFGCTDTLVIHLTVNYSATTYDTLELVVNQLPYTFALTDSTDTIFETNSPLEFQFDYTIPTQMECDSLIHQTVIIYPNDTLSFDTTVCASSLPVDWRGHTFTDADTIIDSLFTIHLSDSIVKYRLRTAHPGPIATATMPELCAGTSDTITVGYQSGASIVLLNPDDITSSELDTVTKVTLVTMSGLWVTEPAINDSTFLLSPPDDLAEDTTVNYVFHLEDSFGCGYDTNFDILFHAHHLRTADTTVCNKFSWNDVIYTASDTIKQPVTNDFGCTDTLVIHLTVNYSATTYDTLELVVNQLPYTFALTDSTDTIFETNSPLEFQFDYTIPTQMECDSLIHQTVIIYPNDTLSFDTTVCASSLPVDWRGHTFTDADTIIDSLFTIHLSDSLITYILHVDSISVSISTASHVNCYGDSTGAVTATIYGGIAPFSCLWTNLLGDDTSTALNVSNLPAGDYIFTVTDTLGCTYKDTTTVNTLHEKMQPGSIAESQSLCDGEVLQSFIGTEAIGGDNSVYLWQMSSADSSNWNEAPGVHNLQNYTYAQAVTESFFLRRAWISQNCGTRYSDTLEIRLWPIHRDTITDNICQNEPYTDNGFNLSSQQTSVPGLLTREIILPTLHCDSVVVLQLNVLPTFEETIEDEVCEGSGYNKHGFSIGAVETIDANMLQRRLVLLSENGCDSTLELRLTVIDTTVEIVSLNPDFCANPMTELSVVSSMTEQYLWNNGKDSAQITVNEPGTYSVTVSQGDCQGSDSFVIENCDFQFILPNAISPNNPDGLNDYFCIPEYYRNFIGNFEIRIFNRWGEQVFFSTDKNFKWKGDYKGDTYHQNIYSYVIHYTNSMGTPFVVKGSVTVL